MTQDYYESKKHNYESEKYNILTMANDIAFDRKLEYETSFDGVVKISRLKTANQNLNSQLNRKNYRGFFHFAQNGVFLRMFNCTASLPRPNKFILILKPKN
jgi:hypothetical protein